MRALVTATRDMEKPGTDLIPLLDCVLETAPAPMHEPGHPLQVLITNLAANDFVGRIAVGRIRNGVVRKGAKITIIRDGSAVTGTVTSLTLPQGIDRVEVPEAGPGEIVGIAGVSGNGQRELLYALSGEDTRAQAQDIQLHGQAVGQLGPNERRQAGLHFVPEERLGRGAVPSLSLAQNMLLTRNEAIANSGWIHTQVLQTQAQTNH